MKKCFEGIATLTFDDDLVVYAMRSAEGEVVELVDLISTAAARGQVEKWLVELETDMRKSVRQKVYLAIEAYPKKERTIWVLEWPGQTVLCVSQLYWTQQIEEAIMTKNDPVGALQKYLDQCQKELNDIILIIRGKLSKQNRITLGKMKRITVELRLSKLIRTDSGLDSRKFE